MLEITESGKRRINELGPKADALSEEMLKLPYPDEKLERRRVLSRVSSKWRRINPYLSILWELNNHGPQTREYFHWKREQPLQEGYIRVHDRSRERTIDELIRRGYVKDEY